VKVNFISGRSKIVGQFFFVQDGEGKPAPKEILAT
jgi:hypothetical protein